jgi:hypothetical protein
MNSKNFLDILDGCPNIQAIFKIKSVPNWVAYGYSDIIKVGTEVFYTPDGCANLVGKDNMKFILGARNVSFVEYRNLNKKVK